MVNDQSLVENSDKAYSTEQMPKDLSPISQDNSTPPPTFDFVFVHKFFTREISIPLTILIEGFNMYVTDYHAYMPAYFIDNLSGKIEIVICQ
mgnify:FL=1